jgi:hypothetical protein
MDDDKGTLAPLAGLITFPWRLNQYTDRAYVGEVLGSGNGGVSDNGCETAFPETDFSQSGESGTICGIERSRRRRQTLRVPKPAATQ